MSHWRTSWAPLRGSLELRYVCVCVSCGIYFIELLSPSLPLIFFFFLLPLPSSSLTFSLPASPSFLPHPFPSSSSLPPPSPLFTYLRWCLCVRKLPGMPCVQTWSLAVCSGVILSKPSAPSSPRPVWTQLDTMTASKGNRRTFLISDNINGQKLNKHVVFSPRFIPGLFGGRSQNCADCMPALTTQ